MGKTKPRQYRSRQGRSDKQYSGNMKVMLIALCGLGVMFVWLIINSIISNG